MFDHCQIASGSLVILDSLVYLVILDKIETNILRPWKFSFIDITFTFQLLVRGVMPLNIQNLT